MALKIDHKKQLSEEVFVVRMVYTIYHVGGRRHQKEQQGNSNFPKDVRVKDKTK